MAPCQQVNKTTHPVLLVKYTMHTHGASQVMARLLLVLTKHAAARRTTARATTTHRISCRPSAAATQAPPQHCKRRSQATNSGDWLRTVTRCRPSCKLVSFSPMPTASRTSRGRCMGSFAEPKPPGMCRALGCSSHSSGLNRRYCTIETVCCAPLGKHLSTFRSCACSTSRMQHCRFSITSSGSFAKLA